MLEVIRKDCMVDQERSLQKRFLSTKAMTANKPAPKRRLTSADMNIAEVSQIPRQKSIMATSPEIITTAFREYCVLPDTFIKSFGTLFVLGICRKLALTRC
jgi:hypothetical protein